MQEMAKLEFGDLLGIGMTLVVTVIGIAMGADVTGDLRDDMTVNTYEYNVTTNGLTGINNLAVRIPTIMTVMVIAIIIGVLVRHLVFRYS